MTTFVVASQTEDKKQIKKKVKVNKIILSQPSKEKQKQNIYYLMKNSYLILCYYSDLGCRTDAYGLGDTLFLVSPLIFVLILLFFLSVS